MRFSSTAYDYDRAAGSYDRSHDRWLRYAGGEAQCAFEGAATALLRPGMSMLDAACGTGTVVRRLLNGSRGKIDIALLDVSRQMLDQCHDIAARRVLGRMEDLPFADNSFDLVTCAWGLEVLNDPDPALREFVRVARADGRICLVFCAERPAGSMLGTLFSAHIRHSRRGRFLDTGTLA